MDVTLNHNSKPYPKVYISKGPGWNDYGSDVVIDYKKYITSYIVGCTYAYGTGQVKQRREQEAGKKYKVRRGGVRWEDKELWTTFLIGDGKTDRESLSVSYKKIASVLNRLSIHKSDTIGLVAVVTIDI